MAQTLIEAKARVKVAITSGKDHGSCTISMVPLRFDTSMAGGFNSPILFKLRALLIVAALICLCVSSNVGLQFFPLPAATSQVAYDGALDQANKASHTPQAEAQCFRVPMMVQSQKRAYKAPPQSDQLPVLPSNRFRLAKDTRVAVASDYTLCVVPSDTVAPRTGRAPPSFS